MLPVLAQVVTDAPAPRLSSVRMTADICVTSVFPAGNPSAVNSPEMSAVAVALLWPAAATAPLSIAMIEVANFRSQLAAVLISPALPSVSAAAAGWPGGTGCCCCCACCI